MTFPPPLPTSVTGALAALVPHDALTRTFARGGRGGNSLSWRQVVIDETRATDLLGAAVPTLPGLRRPGVVQRISVHQAMAGGHSTRQAEAGHLRPGMRITYLPHDHIWEHAQLWPSIRHGGTLLAIMTDGLDRPAERTWPRRLTGRGDGGDDGYAVVDVTDHEVGAQVDVSGVVHLTWLLRRGGDVFRAGLLTRRDPLTALELIVDGGLLT